MKKELLLISLSLFSVTLSAQHIHSIMNKKVRTELTRERVKSDRETQEAQKREEIKNKVNNGIAHYKLERLRKATETVSTNLLDEATIEGYQKRTYTYSKDGKRNEEKSYNWRNEQWNFSYMRQYDYQYDNQQRCIKRSILLDGDETNRVEISYEDENRILKYYELVDVDGLQTLSPIYEVGYDSQMREILNKQYSMGKLVSWKENKFNKEGKEILNLYWTGFNGNKVETTVNGLQTIVLTYRCDKKAPEWTLKRKETTELNKAGRNTLKEVIFYEGEAITGGSRNTYTYDSYNRVIGWTRQIYEKNVFVNRTKEEYTYWGTEDFEPGSEDHSEGPVLTHNYYEWENEQWEKMGYATTTRNEEGIALSAVMVERDKITLNGQEIETKKEGTRTFNEKGLPVLTESKIYRADNNSLLYQEKTENKYDDKNQLTLQSDFRLIGNDWKLMGEFVRIYDPQDRRIMVLSNRHIDEETNRWNGNKSEFAYQDSIASTTEYPVDQNGEFRSIPQYFRSSGVLASGRIQAINLTYDDSGTITNGVKWESQNTDIEIKLPNPENYNDGIDVVSEVGFNTNYSANYNWIDGKWFLTNEHGCYQEGNDIILSHFVEGIIMSKSIFSFDTSKRPIGFKEYDDDNLIRQTIYEYNDDGLLSKKDENGIITTYKYSKHDMTGVEKNTVSVLNVYGRTITADNAEALLQVYSTSGTLVASGIKTVTLPEGGLYIVITGSIRQKIAIR